MIRVAVADDHPVVRQGLEETIRGASGMEQVGETDSFNGLWDLLENLDPEPDVLLLDIKMPGGDALDALRRLGQRHPDIGVLVISTYPEDQFLVRMLRAGAAGYLEKALPAEDILEAIRTAASGGRYVTPSGGRILAEAVDSGKDEQAHTRLSDREFQVLRRLAQGQTVTEMAEEMHLSVKTVSTYRTRMLDKLDLTSDAGAIRYAIQRELAE